MPGTRNSARERSHRLPRESYRGKVAVAFTACVADNQPLFQDEGVACKFIEILRMAVEKNDCNVLIYCFMPDHVHLILQGISPLSDVWKSIVDFKQRSGFWLGTNRPNFRWQKGFYDHVIRQSDDLGAQIRYVASNPVRKELVQNWEMYPYTGAIGIDLKGVIEGVMML